MSSLNYSLPPSKSQVQNPQRYFDQLQSIYNQVAHSNKEEQKFNKNLYYNLIQKDQRRKQQKKSVEKQVNQYENQQIDLFWKMKENQLRQRQRKRKQFVNQTRNVNNKMHADKVHSKSMCFNDGNQLKNQYYQNIAEYQNKFHNEKSNKQKFLQQGKLYNDYKQYQSSIQRQKQFETERKKLQQNDEIQYKRLEQLQKWKKKHLQPHNKQAFDIWDRVKRNRDNKQEALQNYIVYQGARSLNQRTSKMKLDIIQREKQKKQQYIRELHSQLQNNQHRTAFQRVNQAMSQRQAIDLRNRSIDQTHKQIQQRKVQQHKQHLQYLKGQIKPRNLIPQKDKIEYAGIGSPVHIGKVVADDRKKQLEWLQNNLYKDLRI